ncbi:MAG: hypothetical protein WCE44_00785 [Candidatus Velthaea sp.]|jgi:hypothetical protein
MIRFIVRLLIVAAALVGLQWLWRALRSNVPAVDAATPHATPLTGDQVDALLRSAGAGTLTQP